MFRRKRQLRPAVGLLLLAAMLFSGAARVRADEAAPEPSPAAAEMLKSMREKGILSEDEYEDLYRRQAKYEAEQKARSSLPGWLQNWTFGGDFRLRWERQDYGHDSYGPGSALVIGRDNVDAIDYTATGVRDRYRMRLRFGAEKLITEYLTFGMRIATSMGTTYGYGTCGPYACGTFGTALPGDPRSSNTTLGGYFDPKNIYLDRAYLRWQPSFAPSLTFTAGKFENPFLSPDDPADMIVWDHDINPDGIAARYRFDFVPDTLWFDTTAAYFILNEIASANINPLPSQVGDTTFTVVPHRDEHDPYMYGVQGGLTAQPGEWLRLGARASWYDLERLDTTLVAALNGLGNGGDSVDSNPLFFFLAPSTPLYQTGASKGHMDEVQTSAFVSFTPWGERFAVKPFFQWTSITNAKKQNQGWAAGIDLGSPDVLELTLMYAEVQSNGTVALFTDSDLFGGVTNAKGWYLKLERQITSSLWLDATVSRSKIYDEACAYALDGSAPLCSNAFTADSALAQAYDKTSRDRLLIQLDLNLAF